MYIYVWLVILFLYVELPIVVLLYSEYLLFDAWCIICCPKQEENLEVYTAVIAYPHPPWYLLYLLGLMLGVSHAVEVLLVLRLSAGGGVRFHIAVVSYLQKL